MALKVCNLLFPVLLFLSSPAYAELVSRGEPFTIRLSATVVESADYVACHNEPDAYDCALFFQHKPILEEEEPFDPLELSEAIAILRGTFPEKEIKRPPG